MFDVIEKSIQLKGYCALECSNSFSRVWSCQDGIVQATLEWVVQEGKLLKPTIETVGRGKEVWNSFRKGSSHRQLSLTFKHVAEANDSLQGVILLGNVFRGTDDRKCYSTMIFLSPGFFTAKKQRQPLDFDSTITSALKWEEVIISF